MRILTKSRQSPAPKTPHASKITSGCNLPAPSHPVAIRPNSFKIWFPSAYVACTHWLDMGASTRPQRDSDSSNPTVLIDGCRNALHPPYLAPLSLKLHLCNPSEGAQLSSLASTVKFLLLRPSEEVYCGTIRLRQIEDSRGNGKKRLILCHGKFYRGVFFERQYEDLRWPRYENSL